MKFSNDYRGTCIDDYNTDDCYSKKYQTDCDKIEFGEEDFDANQAEMDRTTVYYT